MAPGENADPAGERADYLLHCERQSRRGETEDDGDPAGEGPPYHGERDQQRHNDQDVNRFAQVVAGVCVASSTADQPPG